MRLLTLAIAAFALLAVSVLAVGHWKLSRELSDTKQQVAELKTAVAELQDEAPTPRDQSPALRPNAAVPRFVPPPQPGSPPPPAATGNKEEIQQIVAAQLAQERELERVRRDERQNERGRRFRERIATRLELSPEEGQKFETTLSGMQRDWITLMEPLRDGQKTFAEIRPALDALSERTQKALQDLLGPDRLAKLKELDPSPPGGGPGGGGPNNPNRWLFGIAGGPPARGPMPAAP